MTVDHVILGFGRSAQSSASVLVLTASHLTESVISNFLRLSTWLIDIIGEDPKELIG